MEILFFIGAVVVAIFWIHLFVENADPKKNPIQTGLKKMSEGMFETFDAVGKGATNSLAEYKYKRKFEKGSILSGQYEIQIDMNEKIYNALIIYNGGSNWFDINLLAEKGKNIDLWDTLSDHDKYKINSKIRDHVRELRASIGLSNNE